MTKTMKTRLDAGEIVRQRRFGKLVAKCFRLGGNYVMRSPATGEHRLAASCTDELRLLAHWEGFCETAEAVSQGRVWRGI